MSCSSYPVFAALFRLSYPDSPLLAVLLWLSCSGWPVPTVMFWLPCLTNLNCLAASFWFPYPGCLVHHGCCTRAYGLGSQCRPNECIFGSGKPWGVGILGRVVYEPGEGNGEVSLRATWERGGRILSQLGGFQVSREG